MESPLEAQRLAYGAKKGPPMIYDDVEPPSRPRKRRKLEPGGNKHATDLLAYSIRQKKYASEQKNAAYSPCQLPGGFPPELSFRALAAYSLLRTLSVQLRLSPFTPNVFLRALYLPFPNKLIGQIHVALFRILLPQLQMGFSYKTRGGAVGVHKRRHIDNVRWPLRAGDNLSFLDNFTWPLFYDDYCHLTADRLWASLHDEQLHLDFRYAGLQDIGINDYEVSDEEEELLPVPAQPWPVPTSHSMAYLPPVARQAPKAPVVMERSSRKGRNNARTKFSVNSDSETESEYESGADEDEEAWSPNKKKRGRKGVKKNARPRSSAQPEKSIPKAKSSLYAAKSIPTAAASPKVTKPKAGTSPKVTKPKAGTSPKVATPKTSTSPKVAKTAVSKAKPKSAKKAAESPASRKAKLDKPFVKKSTPSGLKTPRSPYIFKASKVMDVESPVPGFLTDSDKLQNKESTRIIFSKVDKSKLWTEKPDYKKSKVSEVSVATPGAASTPIPVSTESTEKRQKASQDGSETEEEDLAMPGRVQTADTGDEKSQKDSATTTAETSAATSQAKSVENASKKAGNGSDESRRLPSSKKQASSSAGNQEDSRAVVASPSAQNTPTSMDVVKSADPVTCTDGGTSQNKRPRGRLSRRLPMQSVKAERGLSPPTSAPMQQTMNPAAQFHPHAPQFHPQHMMHQQQMMHMQQQHHIMRMQRQQEMMHRQHQMFQMQQQQHLQQYRMQQMAMQGGLKGNFAMNGSFGSRQQQKAAGYNNMQSYGNAAQAYGRGQPYMIPSMMNKHIGSRTFVHEKRLKSKGGFEVADDIASALQKVVCGIELEKPESGTGAKSKAEDEETDPFEKTLDDHRWIHFRPLRALRSGIPYYQLPVEEKIVILEFLIDELLQVDFISAEFSKRHAITECYSHPYGVLPSEKEFKDIENDDECAVCLGEGELLCCDGCVRSYHRRCLDMSLGQALPDGLWLCPECKLVDPANFGPLRGGRKASLDWFTVDDLQLAIKDDEQAKQAALLRLAASEAPAPGMMGMNSASGLVQSMPPTGGLQPHPGSSTIGPSTALVPAVSSSFGQSMQRPLESGIISASQSQHPAMSINGQYTSLVTNTTIPPGVPAVASTAMGPSNANGATPALPLSETQRVHPGGNMPANSNTATIISQTNPQGTALVPATGADAQMSTAQESFNSALAKGLEFIVIHGYVFSRRKSSGSAQGEEGATKRSQLHLVLQRNEVEKYLESMGPKISQAWPLAQIPLLDKSFGIHFPTAKLYLTPLDTFDPSFYASKYRKAPVPLFMSNSGGAHIMRLMSSDFESECAPCNTYKVSDALLRDFSIDKDIARSLRRQHFLFDPYQFIKSYMMKLETSFRRASLVHEFWEAGREKSRHDIWESNLKRAKSIGRLCDQLLVLIDAVHPRAFSEGWFHNPLSKHSDNADGFSDRHFVEMPVNWNATLEKRKRMWERTHPDMLLHLTLREGCSLDGFVKGIRADLLEQTAVVRSKRKKLKASEAGPKAQLKHSGSPESKVPAGGEKSLPPIADIVPEAQLKPSGSPDSKVPAAGEKTLPPSEAMEVQPEKEPEGSSGGSSSALVSPAADTTLPASTAMQVEPAQKPEPAQVASPEESGLTNATEAIPAVLDATVKPVSAARSEDSIRPSSPKVEEVPLDDNVALGTTAEVANAEIAEQADPSKAANSEQYGPEEGATTTETKKAGSRKRRTTSRTPSRTPTSRTRRSGRLTRHAAEVSPFGSPNPELGGAATSSKQQIGRLEFEIEQFKESKVPEIEKIVKGPLLKDVLWPIAGRLPFATLGNLPRLEMRRLARNAGVIQAPHVVYQTSHEVGQVCYAHMWRKRTEQCTGLEELLMLIRVLESYLERPVIHSCETLTRRVAANKANVPKVIRCSLRDPASGTLEYFVENTQRNKCCWMSYQHVDLITLVDELHRRRQVQSSKRLNYLRAKELAEKKRIERERAARAAEAAKALAAKREAERAAKEAARAAELAKVAERKAAAKKEKERKAAESKWSKELQRVLSQHQMDTVLQNSSRSPDVQSQIRNRSLSNLKTVAEGLRQCNFPMTEQQLTKLLDASEKAAMDSLAKRSRMDGKGPSSQRGGRQAQRQQHSNGAKRKNNNSRPVNAMHQQHGRQTGINGNSLGSVSLNDQRQERRPANLAQQMGANSGVYMPGVSNKKQRTEFGLSGISDNFTGFSNVLAPGVSGQTSVMDQQLGGANLGQTQMLGQPVDSSFRIQPTQQPNAGQAQSAIRNDALSQGMSWDQNLFFGDTSPPKTQNNPSFGGIDMNQGGTDFEPRPVSALPEPTGVGNRQFQQPQQFRAQQNRSPFGQASQQQQLLHELSGRPPNSHHQQMEQLLTQFPPAQPMMQQTQQLQQLQRPQQFQQHHLLSQGQQGFLQSHQMQPQPSNRIQQLQQQLEELQRLQQQQAYQQQFNPPHHQNFF